MNLTNLSMESRSNPFYSARLISCTSWYNSKAILKYTNTSEINKCNNFHLHRSLSYHLRAISTKETQRHLFKNYEKV